MRQLTIIAAVSAIFLTAGAALADVVEVQSRVSKAIVYRDCAQVTRQAQADVKEGTAEIVFANVPENVSEDTLTVSARGTAEATIVDAKIKKIFLERPYSDKVRELESGIRPLENSLCVLANQQRVIEEEREFMKSVNLRAGQQIPQDLVTKMPKPEELGALDSFIKDRWQDIFTRELDIKEKARDTSEKLERLRNELAGLRQSQAKEKRAISVELDVAKAGSLTVTASYLMYQARWTAEYDARVNYDQQKVQLVCMGIVSQASGEDWTGIDLTLSTARPTISGKMPELGSWFLRPAPPESVSYDRNVRFKRSMAEEPMALGVANAPVPEDAQMVQEAAELSAQVNEQVTSVTYRIARPVDVRSDGSEHRLPLFSQEFAAQFQYATTPKLSTFAYLFTKVTNEKEQLPAAGVRIFLDGVYVGSSALPTVGAGEEFELYLGVDEGVKVKREKVKEESKEIWIAGIKRNTKILLATYKITIENYKSKDIRVDLFDNVPVSQSDVIAVRVMDMQPKPQQEDYKDKKGVIRWAFDIAPKGKQEVVVSYQVECPREIDIRL